MNTQITKTETQLPATAVDPYAAYGAAIASQTAPFLKFVKGEFKFGTDDEVLPLGTTMVPNMAELKAGYLKWRDSEVVEDKMRLVVEAAAPQREDCGDADRNDWPTDPNGVAVDPWQETTTLPMKCLETGQEFIFTTGSHGGRGAVGKLCTSYGIQRAKRQGELPIIELGATSYRHKTYGEVHVPVFKITGWQSEAKLIAGEASADFDDSVPF